MSSPHTLLPHQALAPDQALRSPNGRVVLNYQLDGNLVLYFDGQPRWDSRTAGHAPGQAVMQADGNFVIYDGNGAAAWSSNTAGHEGTVVTVQDDGNCVLYCNGQPLMATPAISGRLLLVRGERELVAIGRP